MRNLLPQIRKGIDYLFEVQTSEGNFPDSIYPLQEKIWKNAHPTIFSTALITHALLSVKRYSQNLETDIYCKCNILIKKALDFFISEMEMPGLWHFGMRSDEHWNLLPPDTDDTCCISFLLKNYHPYIYFGMNKPLLINNRNDNGLFYTWIIPPGSTTANVIDFVVNVNAILYLGENEYTIKIIDHISNLVNSNPDQLTFYYYTDELCLYYMISRTYAAGVKGFSKCSKSIIKKLLNRQNYSPAFSAMALYALHNLHYCGRYPSDWKSIILDSQTIEGSWDRYPIYQGAVYPDPPVILFGSKALSTALCLEALSILSENII